MAKVEGFDFFPLNFDGDGRRRTPAELDAIAAHVAAAGTTDLVTIAHGFRNDEQEATALYTEFLRNFRPHLARPELASLAGRTLAVVGVFWPSKAFSEGPSKDGEGGGAQSVGGGSGEREAVEAQIRNLLDEDSTAAQRAAVEKAIRLLDSAGDQDAQDQIVRALLSVAGTAAANDDEGLTAIRAQSGPELLAKLEAPIVLPGSGDGGEGGVAAVGAGPSAVGEGGVLGIGSVFSSVFGRIGQVANLSTWYLMKSRSGTVGEKGLAPAIRELKKKAPALRVHVVGHSLGGRLSAACAKALTAAPRLQPDSVSLLEAAFSHYGFSANNGEGEPGFFRAVIAEKIVRGPLVATYSAQDSVVGGVYAIASRVADDNTKAVGDANDKYGGIGRNGTQRTTEHTREKIHQPGAAYAFSSGVVHNLDGSNGPIKDHSDVKNPIVTYAVASAIAAT